MPMTIIGSVTLWEVSRELSAVIILTDRPWILPGCVDNHLGTVHNLAILLLSHRTVTRYPLKYYKQ